MKLTKTEPCKGTNMCHLRFNTRKFYIKFLIFDQAVYICIAFERGVLKSTRQKRL